jgi:hypothetical protein
LPLFLLSQINQPVPFFLAGLGVGGMVSDNKKSTLLFIIPTFSLYNNCMDNKADAKKYGNNTVDIVIQSIMP